MLTCCPCPGVPVYAQAVPLEWASTSQPADLQRFGIRRLTRGPGMHVAAVHPAGSFFSDLSSSITSPTSLSLRPLTVAPGASSATVGESLGMYTLPAATAAARAVAPQLVTLPAADGSHLLFGALLCPDPEAHGPGPYPTVVAYVTECALGPLKLRTLQCNCRRS
jgi:hypothetical protein